MFCHDFAKLQQSRRRTVARMPILHCLECCLTDVHWCYEVGLPNLKVDNISSLGFKGFRFGEYLERRLSPQTVHTSRKIHLVVFPLTQLMNVGRSRNDARNHDRLDLAGTTNAEPSPTVRFRGGQILKRLTYTA